MQQGIMELMWNSSHVSGSNVHYVEALYEQYLDDPSTVPDEWRTYFDQLLGVEGGAAHDVPSVLCASSSNSWLVHAGLPRQPPPTAMKTESKSRCCS